MSLLAEPTPDQPTGLARDWLFLASKARPVPVKAIITAVCERYRLRPFVLRAKRRNAFVARARHIAFYLACELTELSMTQIGRAFDNFDHTTVLHGRDRIARLRADDPAVEAELTELENMIRQDSRR